MAKIIHCDADCFFAAVEMRDNPRLRGVPMAVAGSTSRRGVISTCNYEARHYGVRSAMPTWEARSRCPDLILVPHNMAKYREASQALNRIFADYTDKVERVSIDEAYLDVTDASCHRGSATLMAREIRARAAREVGITVSAGVAANKFLAKVASEWRKPDGLFVIPPERADDFLPTLPVECIHGVGRKTAQRLHTLGVYTCGDVRHYPPADLIAQFGGFGHRLVELAWGVDDRPVRTSSIRKSLSVEHTFEEDLHSGEDCQREVQRLYAALCTRLEGLRSKPPITRLQAKLKFSNFLRTSVETTCDTPSLETFVALVRQGQERERLPVRLLGIGVRFATGSAGEELVSQLELFPQRGAADRASP